MTNHMWKTPFVLFVILLSTSFVNAQRRAPVSAGTPILVRVNEHLSSETAQAGDKFTGSLVQPLVVNGQTQFPRGASVTGRVISASKSGRLSDSGVLELRLVSVGSSSISSQSFYVRGGSHTKSNVAKIGGTTAAGTVIGAVAGGGKGAAIGAGVGAGVGTAAAAATGKKPAIVEAEAVLEFHAEDPSQPSQVLRSAEPPAYSDPEPYDRDARDARDDHQPRYEHRRHRGDDDDEDEDDDHDHDRDHHGRDSEQYERYSFREHDYEVLHDCLAGYDFESLPPGIQKKLARGGSLPPGQAKKLRRLPVVCTERLEPLPHDVDRIIYGDRIILVARGHIIDIFVFERYR